MSKSYLVLFTAIAITWPALVCAAAPKAAAQPADNSGGGNCTDTITFDLGTAPGTIPDQQLMAGDVVCFQYVGGDAGKKYLFKIVDVGPRPPLLTWADVSQIIGGGGGNGPASPTANSKAGKTTAPATVNTGSKNNLNSVTAFSDVAMTVTADSSSLTVNNQRPFKVTSKLPAGVSNDSTYVLPTGTDIEVPTCSPDSIKAYLDSKNVYKCPVSMIANGRSQYTMQSGGTITAVIWLANAGDNLLSWTETVTSPLPTPWYTFVGGFGTSGYYDKAYTLSPTATAGQSQILDVSQETRLSIDHMYGSLFWIRDNDDWYRRVAVGFGFNGGQVSGFLGLGDIFDQSVGFVYGIALAPKTVLTPQYQHIYDSHGTVSSSTNIGSLTTKTYGPTLFLGLGVTFCFSSCPGESNQTGNQPKSGQQQGDDTGNGP